MTSRMLALGLLIAAWAAPAAAQPEHVSGLPSGDLLDAGLSGDGRWMAWAEDTPPKLILKDLSGDDVPVTLVLRSTTGDSGLDLPNDVYPGLSRDGGVIALAADGPIGTRRPELLLVVDRSGVELLRVDVYDWYDSPASFGIGTLREDVFVDDSGEYVVFTTEAERLVSRPAGGGSRALSSPGGLDVVYRVRIADGAMDAVSVDTVSGPSTGWLDDGAQAHGMSEGGRYVLFSSDAGDLPGATGQDQLYRRDMGTAQAPATTIELVSLGGGQAPLFEVQACTSGCRSASLSDDGSKALYRGIESAANPADPGTWLWTEGSGADAVSGLGVMDEQLMAGNCRWMTASGEPFTRLDLADGSVDALNESMAANRISDDGSIVLFHSDSLSPPPGQSGRYWVQRHAAPPPATVEIRISDSVTVSDDILTRSGVIIRIADTITVQDTETTQPSPSVQVAEVIHLGEQVNVTLGTPPDPVPTLDLDYLPPLLPGSPLAALGAGLEPLAPVQLWLESTPVLVATGNAGANGAVRFDIRIPTDFPAGSHSVVLAGTDAAGQPVRVVAAIFIHGGAGTVESVPGPGQTALWLLALLLLVSAGTRLRQVTG